MDEFLVNKYYDINTKKTEAVHDIIGTRATVSDQGTEQSCGAHASSKGATDILDDHGYDLVDPTNQIKEITETLIKATNSRHTGVKSLSEFDKV